MDRTSCSLFFVPSCFRNHLFLENVIYYGQILPISLTEPVMRRKEVRDRIDLLVFRLLLWVSFLAR